MIIMGIRRGGGGGKKVYMPTPWDRIKNSVTAPASSMFNVPYVILYLSTTVIVFSNSEKNYIFK